MTRVNTLLVDVNEMSLRATRDLPSPLRQLLRPLSWLGWFMVLGAALAASPLLGRIAAKRFGPARALVDATRRLRAQGRHDEADSLFQNAYRRMQDAYPEEFDVVPFGRMDQTYCASVLLTEAFAVAMARGDLPAALAVCDAADARSGGRPTSTWVLARARILVESGDSGGAELLLRDVFRGIDAEAKIRGFIEKVRIGRSSV